MRAVSLVELSAVCSLGIAAVAGVLPDGTPVELSFIGLVACRSGLLANLEIYPVEQLDAARSRFKELAAQQLRPSNLAARRFDLVNRAFADRDWDAFRALLTEDLIAEDRRRGLASRGHGPDSFVRNFQTVADLGFLVSAETVALRGERLVLLRTRTEDAEHNVIAVPAVLGVDESGLFESATYFDEDSMADAIAELDQRYIEGEGAAYAEILRLSVRCVDAWNARDWYAFALAMSADVRFVDHRPSGLGATQGRDALVTMPKTMTEVAPDIRHSIVSYHAISPHCAVGQWLATGTNEEGGEFEIAYLQLVTMSDGSLDLVERYDVDQLDEALARFSELDRVASLDGTRLENAAVRTWDALFGAMGDEDALRLLVAPDVIGDDRRPGFRSSGRGMRSFLKNFAVVHEIGLHPTGSDVLAVRGDSFALIHARFSTPQAFDADVLTAVELDEHGLLGHYVVFDPSDTDAAFVELDRMYLAGDEVSPVALVAYRLGEVVDQLDPIEFASHFTEDFVFVDHRPASSGGYVGADEYFTGLKVLRDLVPDLRIRVIADFGVSEHHVFGHALSVGQTRDGAAVEYHNLIVIEEQNGLVRRIDAFAVEDRAEAERYFERAEFSRNMNLHLDVLNARDWSAFRALIADDVVVRDLRKTSLADADDAETFIANTRALTDLLADHRLEAREVIVARGPNGVVRALATATDLDGGAIEIEYLLLSIFDDGRLVRMEFLDPAAADDAAAHLEELIAQI